MLAVTAEANETAATRAVDVNFMMMMLKSCDAEEEEMLMWSKVKSKLYIKQKRERRATTKKRREEVVEEKVGEREGVEGRGKVSEMGWINRLSTQSPHTCQGGGFHTRRALCVSPSNTD